MTRIPLSFSISDKIQTVWCFYKIRIMLIYHMVFLISPNPRSCNCASSKQNSRHSYEFLMVNELYCPLVDCSVHHSSGFFMAEVLNVLRAAKLSFDFRTKLMVLFT